MSQSALDEDGLLRARHDIWIDSGGASGRSILLGGLPTRYFRVPGDTADLLFHLAGLELGETVRATRDSFPSVDLEGLVRLGLVDHIPAHGLAVSRRLVIELWRRNLAARSLLSRQGWAAIGPRMGVSGPDSRRLLARPLTFDEIEAAARISFALPFTSRQCTVVALAIHDCLVSRGFKSRIAVVVGTGQILMHSQAMVGRHVVDPGDTVVEASELVPLSAGEIH